MITKENYIYIIIIMISTYYLSLLLNRYNKKDKPYIIMQFKYIHNVWRKYIVIALP